jgi:hypothetical protein
MTELSRALAYQPLARRLDLASPTQRSWEMLDAMVASGVHMISIAGKNRHPRAID